MAWCLANNVNINEEEDIEKQILQNLRHQLDLLSLI